MKKLLIDSMLCITSVLSLAATKMNSLATATPREVDMVPPPGPRDRAQVGWFGPARPTRLTADEQFTHMSLWCLLSSPLLLSCDLERLDDVTLSLLENDEVLEIDQEALGKQAVQVGGEGELTVYAKPMDDGSLAVGLFNTVATKAMVTANWSDLKITSKRGVRNVWRQKDLSVFTASLKRPSHRMV